MARWPGHIAPGTESAHVSAFWDFMPTAAELADVAAPEATDGISYLPTLLGENQAPHEYLYWEFPEKGYQVGLRQEKWKAVRKNMESNPDGPIELYDLEQDLGEENDVADQHPEVVRKMTQLMRDAHVPSARFPMPGEPTVTAQQ